MLRFCAAVEAQDEVLALVVGCALFASRPGQQEGSPICDAAYYAPGGENDVTSCTGDSGGKGLEGLGWGCCEGMGGVLFDFVDAAAGADLAWVV